jgi:hypothetical protein
MKAAMALIAMGVAGFAVYAYVQLTSLSSEFVGYAIGSSADPEFPGSATPIYVRDWTVGLAGAIIGIILLGIGVYRLRRYRKSRNATTA